jgi:hypothetical protein
MKPGNSNAHRNLKLFLQQAPPLIHGCKDALTRRDAATLRQQSSALQASATATGQVLIGVQARLLEQAAEHGQLHRASYLLMKIRDSLSIMLSEFKASASAEGSPISQEEVTSNINKRLGAYLVEAELLTKAQIDVALADQKMTGARLGDILVTRGWIKQGTIEYFMQKVIIPERKEKQRSTPEPRPQEVLGTMKKQPPQHQTNEVNSRATLIDEHISTFIDRLDRSP